MQRKALYSEALGKSISLKVTTYALRQMDRMGACGRRLYPPGFARAHFEQTKSHAPPSPPHPSPSFRRAGGLDNYILGTPPHQLASLKGEALRRQITKAAAAPPAAKPELR